MRARLKESHAHGSCSDSAFANDVSFCLVPCDRWNLKQDGIAKSFASANPSWACAYAPKMEEFCKTLFFRRSSSERRTAREASEGTSGFPSWLLLGKRQEVASNTAQRGAQLDEVEVGCTRVRRRSCGKFSYPSSTLYPRAPHPSVRKSCSKYHQIPLKKSIFCPICRLTYTILYAIMYAVRFFFPNITFFANDIR